MSVLDYENEARAKGRAIVEDRIDYLRSRTEFVNDSLEHAIIPRLSKSGYITRVRHYIFNGEFIHEGGPGYKIVYKTDKIDFLNVRKRAVCDSTITFCLLNNESLIDFSKRMNMNLTSLIQRNPDIPVNNTSLEGTQVKTDKRCTMENMYRYGLINKFAVFLDGYYVSMENIEVKTDGLYDYIIVWAEDVLNAHTDINLDNIDILQCNFLTERSEEGKGNPILKFDETGCLNNEGSISVWTTDGHVKSRVEFCDNNHVGVTGTQYNHWFRNFPYWNKIKKENIFCFQNGRMIKDVPIETHNGNIATIEFPPGGNNKAVLFYNEMVIYDQDNAMRIPRNILPDVITAFRGYLNSLENACEKFINTIYEYMEADPTGNIYGFVVRDYRLNCMEEGCTPLDECIFYLKEETRQVLDELVGQLFADSSMEVLTIMHDIVESAYYENLRDNPNFTPNEWFLRKHLPEMFVPDHSMLDYLDDFSLFDISFNFQHTDRYNFNRNIENAAWYIDWYDADKLTTAFTPWNYTETFTRKELIDNGFLVNTTITMGRRNVGNKDTFVIVFLNGNLISTYHQLTYTDTTFSLPVSSLPLVDDDVFQFVFYTRCNNKKKQVTFNKSMIQNVTEFSQFEVQLYDHKIRGNRYPFPEEELGSPVQYSIPFTIDLPWVFNRGSVKPSPGPTPGPTGSVMTRQEVILHYDDNDTSVDDVIYFVDENAMNTAIDMINDQITDPDLKELLIALARRAHTTDHITEELSLRRHLADTIDDTSGEVADLIEDILQLEDDTTPVDPGGDDDEDEDDYGEAEIGVLIDDPELYRLLPSEDDIRFNYGDTATVCSLRQFHYYREEIEEDYCEYITLPHDTFIYCSNPEYAPHMYMVFINHKFLPDSYVISFPQLDSPVYENRVYFNTPVRQGNIVEVFYIPDFLWSLTTCTDATRADYIQLVPKDDETLSAYITLPRYVTNSLLRSEHLSIFINGKRVSPEFILNVSQDRTKILDVTLSKDAFYFAELPDEDDPDYEEKLNDLVSHTNVYISSMNPELIANMQPLHTLQDNDTQTLLNDFIPNDPDKTDRLMDVVDQEPSENDPEVFVFSKERSLLQRKMWDDFMEEYTS